MKIKTYIGIILAEVTAILWLLVGITWNMKDPSICMTSFIWSLISTMLLLHYEDVWTFMTTMDEKVEG